MKQWLCVRIQPRQWHSWGLWGKRTWTGSEQSCHSGLFWSLDPRLGLAIKRGWLLATFFQCGKNKNGVSEWTYAPVNMTCIHPSTHLMPTIPVHVQMTRLPCEQLRRWLMGALWPPLQTSCHRWGSAPSANRNCGQGKYDRPNCLASFPCQMRDVANQRLEKCEKVGEGGGLQKATFWICCLK